MIRWTDYVFVNVRVFTCMFVCFFIRGSLRQVRRRLTAHEIDIKDLEAAVREQGQESPREEIARLRRLQIEPEHYQLENKLVRTVPSFIIFKFGL